MDVYGRQNAEAYFRANVWSWRPLHLLMQEANVRFKLGISQKLLVSMTFNEGAGLKRQTACDHLADALEKLLPEYADVISFDQDPQGAEGQLIRLLQKAGLDTDRAIYQIEKEHVKEFIGFLRECDGFCVW